MNTRRLQLSHEFPIIHKPYKTAQAVKYYAQLEIRNLLDAKTIQKLDSDYAFAVLFVKSTDKKTVKYRMVVDYKTLNEFLEGFPYPVPDVKTILLTIIDMKLYTVSDLHSFFFKLILGLSTGSN